MPRDRFPENWLAYPSPVAPRLRLMQLYSAICNMMGRKYRTLGA